MDRVRSSGQGRNQHQRFILLAAVLAVSALAWWLMTADLASRRVDGDSLRIDTVSRRDLAIEVTANGVLLPLQVEWIAAQVEGRVSTIKRRAGERVQEGEILIELSNPELINTAEEARSALEGGRAALLSYEVDLQNELLNQQAVVLRAKFAYESALLRLDAETRLKETSDIIPDIDYRRTQLEVEQLRANYGIERLRTSKRETNIETQMAAKNAQVEQLARGVERAQNKVQSLTVRAGMTGMVQQMDLEIGQHIPPGAQIARIARQEELYAELKVLSRQAIDITLGQSAVIDTRNGTLPGRVSRVDPAVNQGSVIVDVSLTGPLPHGAKPELQVEGTITIDRLEGTLVVGKPSYSRADSQLTLYRLSPGGDSAERVQVKTGRTSVNEIEIVSGLEAGDRIILSDTSDWQDQNKIRIH